MKVLKLEKDIDLVDEFKSKIQELNLIMLKLSSSGYVVKIGQEFDLQKNTLLLDCYIYKSL